MLIKEYEVEPFNGKGRFLENGQTYIGDIVNGRKHGEGLLISEEGEKY